MNPGIRRRTLIRTLMAVTAIVMGAVAHAQYPVRPVRVVVPATAGDGSDVLARLVGRHLSDSLGQPVVIENRPGAGGSIAGAVVAVAAPDGYTLMLANGSSHGVTPGLYPKLPYDTINDFAPVTLIASSPNLLVVHPALPAAGISEFLAYVRAHPGRVNIASAGNGSLSHLSVEILKGLGRLDMVNVGYKGASPALNDLVAGQVQAMIINIPSTLPLVKSGKLRALAATSAKRTPLLPDLPTLAEAGLAGYETLAWFGLVAPAKTPASIVSRLQVDTSKIVGRADMREQLANLGAEPVGNTPEAFAAFIQSEVAKYGRVIRESGIKVE